MTRRVGWPRRGAVRRAVSLTLALAAGGTTTRAQEVRWTGTVSYSRGSYVFDAPTRTGALYTGLGITWGRLELDGSIPFLVQNTELVSQVAGTALPTGGADHGIVGERQPGQTLGTRGRGAGGGGSSAEVVYRNELAWSVGDPFLTAGARAYEGSGRLRSIRARVTAKPPLRGIESGVGTGAWDVGAGGTAIASLGPTYVFADLAYWWYGDLAELELVDGLAYSAGVSYSLLQGRGSVMISFLGSERVIATMDPPSALALGVSYLPRLGRSLSGGVALGLSESSPDFSLYAGWSLRLG